MPCVMKESDIVRAILDYLQLKGIFAWRVNNGGIYRGDGKYSFSGTKGVADIIGVLKDGKILTIECKTKKGKLSIHQDLFLDTIMDNGGVALVATGWQEVEDDLKELGYL